MNKNKYQNIIFKDQRRVILEILAQETDGYAINAELLQRALGHAGHKIAYDLVCNHLTWLSDQGLVRLEMVGTLPIANLTRDGLDVAQGHRQVRGVARPMPE